MSSRVIMRAIALCVLTGAMYALWLSATALIFPFKHANGRWRNFIFKGWAKATASIMGMRIEVQGLPPSAPFFLVSNHLSYMDVVAFASQLDCVFIAKSDVASWPLVGLLCRSMNTIFIDRNNRQDIPRVIALIEQALRKGRGVVLFAEGTSTEGTRVAPFNPSLLEPAAKTNYPVSYASLTYRTPNGEVPAHLSVCWWGDMTFIRHLLDLFRLPEFYATLVFGPETFQERDRKVLARKLWHAVSEQFTPVVVLEEECSSITR